LVALCAKSENVLPVGFFYPHLGTIMRTNFDAIVLGSGYGGAVSAYRLAQAGLSVVVLETGYEQKAPNIPRGQESEWCPDKGHFGPHTINHLSNSVTAWRGTAVGGGSIVNAAVMIRKNDFENWPGKITRQSLDPYYDRAELMLGATVYPLLMPGSPYAATTKTAVMLEAARKLGTEWVMPPVAITFRNRGEAVGTVKTNLFGARQQGCRQCGECSLPGCNYQAKNSLDFNYLHAAQTLYGASIQPGNRADKIEPVEGGYLVTTNDPKTGEERLFNGRIVVVAGGSIGSSELLLRNNLWHKTLPALSARLGRQYTTNGTFIGIAVRSRRDLDPSGGPEITAGLDFPGPDGKSQGHLIFDGSFRAFSYDTFYVTGRLVRLRNWTIKLIGAAFRLAEKINFVEPRTTLPLLVIGRDDAVGSFSLDQDGRLQTDLNPQDNASFYARANRHMKAFTRAMGTSFLRFPLWSLQSKIDVPHNLGGVPMGSNIEDGVVDDMGRVFGYDNLLVLDGSIIPASLGANPALTIAALAERSMEHVVPQFKNEGVIRARSVPLPVIPAANDCSVDFARVLQEVEAGRALPEALKGKTVLWTAGILARHMGNHSVQILARLRSLGLNLVALPINTDVATQENIVLIKRAIGELQEGEGILVGHSRGGVMNLDAYRQLSPEDKAKISRMILVQSPVNGTPLADIVLASSLRAFLPAATRVIFGNNIVDTLRELSTSGREAAQRALPPLTNEDRTKIWTLRSKIAQGQSPSFEFSRRLNERYGQESDGITPYRLSEIRAANDVTLLGYDHENMVIQKPTLLKRLTGYRPSREYEAGDVIESLLRLAYR
jgi:cholesterol oxidase